MPTAEPIGLSTITGVTRSTPALTQPGPSVHGQVTRYGLGFVFQVGPTTAAVSCNIRIVGPGRVDFEDGTDVIVFDELTAIASQRAVVCARNDEHTDPATGRRRVAVNYPIVVGFVPYGARRPDGSSHPYAGTGFGFSEVLCHELNDQGFFTLDQPFERQWYVYQFVYDGVAFQVTNRQMKSADAPLTTADGRWSITAPGMSCAIPDGDDLLFAVVARDSQREAAGVSRWRRHDHAWQPVAFVPVSDGSEPSLIRDTDGALLYSVRGAGEEGTAVRVWRSSDSGQSWQQLLHYPALRAAGPVVLNQAADGTPYIAANHRDSLRATMCVWPLTSDRTALLPPIVARDCTADFGPPPEGTVWFADHPTATTVRLADGNWHNLLAYRVWHSERWAWAERP